MSEHTHEYFCWNCQQVFYVEGLIEDVWKYQIDNHISVNQRVDVRNIIKTWFEDVYI